MIFILQLYAMIPTLVTTRLQFIAYRSYKMDKIHLCFSGQNNFNKRECRLKLNRLEINANKALFGELNYKIIIKKPGKNYKSFTDWQPDPNLTKNIANYVSNTQYCPLEDELTLLQKKLAYKEDIKSLLEVLQLYVHLVRIFALPIATSIAMLLSLSYILQNSDNWSINVFQNDLLLQCKPATYVFSIIWIITGGQFIYNYTMYLDQLINQI